MDFLKYSNGYNSLKKISNQINLDHKTVKKISLVLLKNGLIRN